MRIPTAEFIDGRVFVWNKEEGKEIYNNKYFGKWITEDKKEYLLLSLYETCYLLERDKIKVVYESKKIKYEDFFELANKYDKEFPQKYAVFKDLRNKGYIVKSGFKFGTHFRVYDKGINPYKEGIKSAKEHTKYNVHAVLETYSLSMAEWSRFVRLSHNIRAKALLAVVDEEGDITYYEIIRIKP